MEWVIGYWQISIQRIWPENQQLIQMYNSVAANWHLLVQCLGYRRAYAKLFQTLQQFGVLKHLQDGASVCDCGIGTSAFTLALAKTVSSQLHVTGVDISPEMLRQTQQYLTQAGVEYQLCQSDVKNLPFNDSTFDLVISAHMLEHLPHPVVGLRDMVRVLRPGAPLILAVTRPGVFCALIQWRWGNGCLSQETIAKMMTDVGLMNVRGYSFTAGLARWTSFVCVGYKKFTDSHNT